MATGKLSDKVAADKTPSTRSKAGSEEKIKQTERKLKRAEAQIERLKAAIANENMVTKQVRGFVDFLREQSVVGLAIGLVLGTQSKVLVDQMVKSFFDPLIGLLLPGNSNLVEKTFTISIGTKSATFAWGAFAISLLTFVIVAAVVYYVFKGLRLDRLDKKKE